MADVPRRPAPERDPNEQPAGRPPATQVPRRWAGRPLAETRWLLEYWRLWVDPALYGIGLPPGDGLGVGRLLGVHLRVHGGAPLAWG